MLKILSLETKGLAYNYIRCIIKGNTRKLWKHFKEAVGKTHFPVPHVLKIDGVILTDSFSIASHFNTYFSSIADKL